MLTIVVGAEETFDDATQEFGTRGGTVLELEHSLVSLSKWESITEKAFLGAGEKSDDDVFLYIKCMSNVEIPPEVFSKLDQANIDAIDAYINAKMTATWFNDDNEKGKSQEVITSELIYYWIASYRIPLEVEKWHINRLFTLLRVFNVKNSDPKKISKAEIARRNRELNAKRRKELGTKG